MADFDRAGTGAGAFASGTGNTEASQGAYGSYSYNGYAQPGQAGYTGWGDPDPAYTSDGSDFDTASDGGEPLSLASSPGLGRAVSLMGAVASLALVVGIGIWGYKLVARDVSGVPVVRAIEGPMRIQPADPGGTPADHQGLAVNAVAAQGTAAAPADRLMLAPKPVSLTGEDQPIIQQAPNTNLASADLQIAEAIPLMSEDASADAGSIAAYQDGQVDALVQQLTEGVPTLLDEDPAETDQVAVAQPGIVQPEPLKPLPAAADAVVDVQPAVFKGPGLARSLRPVLRPARSPQTQALQTALTTATDTSAALDVDPDTLPAGTRLAQLGAYDSVGLAQSEWDRLSGRFGDYLDGKKRVIQKASSGGRTFYRLRAMGFDDLSDARRFCSALVAGNADCIPVTTR
ncbi:SPOR domain-containing protein [Rhodobacteraceae bacterium M382]|nr:SPOR domain-containing protein [Rhodobacteraceae bacterium M382]